MKAHENTYTRSQSRLHPLIVFFMGTLALYCSHLVFTGNAFAESSPLVPHVLHTYSGTVHLMLSMLVTLAGAAAMLSGMLYVRRAGLSSRYGVAALIGATSGGGTLIMGLSYLSFIIYVTY